MIIQLAEAKTFLRVDITDDDTLIQTLIDASEAHITSATGLVFDSTYPLAKTVSFMLVASWYSNRENAQQLGAGSASVLNGLITQLSSAYAITPPQVPVGLTGLAELGYVWLRWRTNIAPDVAGYNVYRGSVKINDELVTERTHRDRWPGIMDSFAVDARNATGVVGYRDRTVTSGQAYAYQVSAVDTLGNESALSVAVNVVAL